MCVLLTLFHLRKLHRDLTKANVEAVRVAGLVTTLVNVTGGGGGSAGTGTPNVNGERVIIVLKNYVPCIQYTHVINNRRICEFIVPVFRVL